MNKKEMIGIMAIIDAPIGHVWELYTNAQHVVHWNHASDDWHSPRAENDLKPGGKFNYRMEAKDGSFGFDFWGIYDLVDKNKTIAYTMGDGRKAQITFSVDGNQTHIVTKFEAENMNSVELQRNGWQAILNNFKTYAEEKYHE